MLAYFWDPIVISNPTLVLSLISLDHFERLQKQKSIFIVNNIDFRKNRLQCTSNFSWVLQNYLICTIKHRNIRKGKSMTYDTQFSKGINIMTLHNNVIVRMFPRHVARSVVSRATPRKLITQQSFISFLYYYY